MYKISTKYNIPGVKSIILCKSIMAMTNIFLTPILANKYNNKLKEINIQKKKGSSTVINGKKQILVQKQVRNIIDYKFGNNYNSYKI